MVKFKNVKLCPVSAFKNLLHLHIKNDLSAVFATPKGHVITYYMFQKKFRACLDNIGLDSKNFSTHSFRRGFATLAFQSKIPPEHIQLLGDWKSDAYKCYLQLSWVDKLDILKSMFNDLI